MKRIICLLGLGFLLMTGISFAEEKDELQVTMGIKTWYNTWSEQFNTGYGTGRDRFYKSTSDPVLSIGPTISFKKGQYFGGVTYLQAVSDYKTDFTYRTSATARTHTTESTSRYDIDGLAGYYFHPRVGGFVGYKYAHVGMKRTEDYLDNSGNRTDGKTEKLSVNIYGPVLGLTANYPLGTTGLTPFANLSYYWVKQINKTEPADSANMSGPSIELGIGYAAYKNLTLTAAYKYQIFYGTTYDDVTFKGPSFSVNYTF
ncbi:MAG: hypothetical protein AABY50_00610 [Nitrospirota bacterium]